MISPETTRTLTLTLNLIITLSLAVPLTLTLVASYLTQNIKVCILRGTSSRTYNLNPIRLLENSHPMKKVRLCALHINMTLNLTLTAGKLVFRKTHNHIQ